MKYTPFSFRKGIQNKLKHNCLNNSAITQRAALSNQTHNQRLSFQKNFKDRNNHGV